MNRRTTLALSAMTVLIVALPELRAGSPLKTSLELGRSFRLTQCDSTAAGSRHSVTLQRDLLFSLVMVILSICIRAATSRNLYPTTAPRELPRRIRRSCTVASRPLVRIRSRAQTS